MTTSTGWHTLTPAGEQFATALLARPDRALLAFDFDGTLAPMVADPELAGVADVSRTALLRLIRQVGQVAIITGRPVAQVRQLARLDDDDFTGLVVLGQYGVERLDVATGQVRSPEVSAQFRAAVAQIGEVVSGLASSDDRVAGSWLEDKGRAVGVHSRRAADPVAALAALTGPITEIAHAHGLPLEPGRLVLEVREAATTKAEALRELVDETSPELVLMAGDDLGDLPAFDELARLAEAGLVTCCLVSGSAERPELAARADIVAEGTDGVSAWLASVVSALARSSEAG